MKFFLLPFALLLILAGCVNYAAPEKLYSESDAKDCGRIIVGHVNPSPQDKVEETKQCLIDAFNSCEKAKALQDGTTIEGDKIISFIEIQGRENGECKVFTSIASGDKFGQSGNIEKTCQQINESNPSASCK